MAKAAKAHIKLVSPPSSDRLAFLDSVFLFFASMAFFLLNVRYPATKNFDEFHYIPSAIQWIAMRENQNWEHPPLAKILISFGIRAFGDNPFGWRAMSVVFGGITLAAMYRLGYELFGGNRRAAWIVAALTFFNQLLYVQARIAMLDTFMMAFLALSLWFFVRAIQPSEVDTRWIRRSGIFMGLAIACKWFSLVPWMMCGGLFALQAIRLHSKTRLIEFTLYWIVVPLLVYYATFLPYLFLNREPAYTLGELLTTFQTRMLDGQKRVVNTHPYMSQFWDWIWMRRPIWYAFDKEGESVRGVVLLGNPAIMWGGLVAVIGLIIEVIRKRAWVPALILYFYLGFAFCWIVIPRKIAFYYYYYPAGMMLGLALTYWIMRSKRDWVAYGSIAIAAGFFAYFFPILGALSIPANSFIHWMWLPTWI